MSKSILVLLQIFFLCCTSKTDHQTFSNQASSYQQPVLFKIIKDIPLPPGYQRIKDTGNSFTEWLRSVPLKKDNHVYLYNGSLKRNQTVQFAVLNITIGNRDLQQCADAVMRLRAEYLFAVKRFNEISFTDNTGKKYKWLGKNDRKEFESYLQNVFGWCNSASLEKQLKPVNDFNNIQPGDVLIKGGFPGHAMLITDVAINTKGKKIFMLAQSYMPAQDIHIVKNLSDESMSPWYEVNGNSEIVTPEYLFYKNQLRRW